MLVTKTADVRCDARDGSEAETFTVAAYEIAALGSEPGRVARRLPVYEFYWANLSRGGTGFIAELKQSWQCVVGLPRIGYQALTHPAGNRFSRAILALMRPIYCIAWVLIVVRLLVSLLLIFVMGRMTEDQIRNTWLRYYDVVFLIDLATAALILLFSTLRAVLWAAEREASHALHAAGLTLAITLLVTQALPLTILEFTGFDQRVYRLRTWFDISPGGGHLPDNGAPWFYYINSLPGFIPYLDYGLITLWAITTGLFYAIGVRRPTIQPADGGTTVEHIERRMSVIVARGDYFWRFMTFVVLFITPLIWVTEFVHIRTTSRSLFPLYEPGTLDILQYIIKGLWYNFVSYIAFVFIWGILTLPWLRREFAPLLELVFDVSNYFPPVPILDDHPTTRLLLGGQRHPPHFGTLRQALAIRLREVLLFAHRRHGGTVAVVGHSLGSIIALSALDGWPSEVDELRVDLVTMGSPFSTLETLFPHVYGRRRTQGGWQLPCVRRWLNLYRAGDPIGRKLAFTSALDVPSSRPKNELIGNGGHLNYFGDDEVASRIVSWLSPTMTTPS